MLHTFNPDAVPERWHKPDRRQLVLPIDYQLPDFKKEAKARRRGHKLVRMAMAEHCAYCGKPVWDRQPPGPFLKPMQQATADHVIPLSRGGHPTDPRNLVTACRLCNETKGARTPQKWARDVSKVTGFYKKPRRRRPFKRALLTAVGFLLAFVKGGAL